MIYILEPYYGLKLNRDKAVLVTAQWISAFCHGYSAKLLCPKKGIKEEMKEGKVGKKTVKELLRWINDNSVSKNDVTLLLYRHYPPQKKDTPVFGHYESCCWNLDLTEKDTKQLQTVLKKEHLPIDLFYPADKTICVRHKGFWGWLGFQKCYSPKQWAEVNFPQTTNTPIKW